MIYLDNAATTYPKPLAVRKANANALQMYSANPGRSGHKMSQEAAMEIYNCRKDLADFFGSEHPEHVVFTLNCTQAINFVLKGLLKPGDHVVTSSLEHNAVMRPLHGMAKMGITYDVAEVFIGDSQATYRSFEQAIGKQTAAVIVTHASNVCGARLPIERIGMLCKKFEIPFIVDAAQTAGIFPIDMKDMNIDYLCIAAHKGLYAPMGVGVLIADGNHLSTIIEGGTGSSSIDFNQPEELPERLESGTVNTPGIIALHAGLDFVKSKGIHKIFKHEIGLIQHLYKRLREIPGVMLYHEFPAELEFAPVLSFNVAQHSSISVATLLDKAGFAVRAGLHCAPTAHKRMGTLEKGTVRVCPSAFTTFSDINTFADSIIRIAKN